MRSAAPPDHPCGAGGHVQRDVGPPGWTAPTVNTDPSDWRRPLARLWVVDCSIRPNPTMKAAPQTRSWLTRAAGAAGARMASFASKELANRARAKNASRTARFTQSDARLKPAGRRGSTIVARTFAHVATTTSNPTEKRNVFMASCPRLAVAANDRAVSTEGHEVSPAGPPSWA